MLKDFIEGLKKYDVSKWLFHVTRSVYLDSILKLGILSQDARRGNSFGHAQGRFAPPSRRRLGECG